MHNLLQNMTIVNNTQIPRILCALLFIVQKYEPTNERLHPIRVVISKLFGDRTSVQPIDILEQELFILDAVDYNLETTNPYSFLMFYF